MQLDQKAPELLDEGLEILTNLTDSIARHGNYSPESTCTFIDQAASSFREAKGILQAVQPVPVVTYEPEFQTAPDNGTVDEVLAYVLDCARRWEPKARIIGNARAGDIVRALTATASAEPVAWQPIETAPKEQEVLIAYWRWRNSMSPGSVIVQSARQVEYHGDNIWSWVVEDNKHGPFPIRGWCDGDMIGWQSLPAAPVSGGDNAK